MEYIEVPQPVIRESGLYDFFLEGMAEALHMKKEDAKKLLNI